MTTRELHQLIQQLQPVWSADESKLQATAVLDEALLMALTHGVEDNFIDEMVSINGQRKVRKLETVNEAQYGNNISFAFNFRGEAVPIFPSIEKLAQANPIAPPSFIIYQSAERNSFYDSTDDECNPSGEIKHYLEIAEIWKILKGCCDHTISVTEITFLYRKKLTLKSIYNPDVLKQEFDGLDRFTRILKDLDNDAHKDGKAHILQNSLVGLLGHIPEKERFEFLLLNFTKFTSRFDDAYHAYVVGFSFDDLRKEHEERYREYMVKINDIVSSSLIKALMIPGALYLTATRTQSIQTSKTIAHGLEATIVNVGIGVAAIAICMIYWWILNNENSSLTSIKLEYSSLMGRLKDKSTDAYKAIEQYVKTLDKKITDAESAIGMLKFINVLSVIASLGWVIARFIF
ncbi:TPA: hypothetical protein I7147_01700 [Vibrio vulnificus]|uniref:hypothetical protein n=1 Tax=Vibrio vulnificus TaxID=672 RepID=UPI000C7B3F6D|nr:hypothetical protein [Vibrio vulnificus]AUL98249.1 putative phage-related membrane protein [Vibrio vulnificus]EHU4913594.1 hypothetical protein [Vibrio vulnificus]EHU4917521.1 hypothetical protein [Vibrio vulnificus]EIT7027113.1 hypothetical protein [Vibrio vulnificus]EIT7028844.1 hypothetical protein [Vibrio vulnificus]